jgi:arginase family enzyme
MILANEEVVVTDVTEVNPRLDSVNGITSINAARVVFEILAGYAGCTDILSMK